MKLTKEEILNMENERMIFEIIVFRREKRLNFKKKYPSITETEMLTRLKRSQAYKFRDKQKRLINEMLEDGISKMRGFREV